MAAPPPDDIARLVGRLFDQHGPALYRHALMLLGDSAAAEAAVQQVFAALLSRRTGDRPSGAARDRRRVRAAAGFPDAAVLALTQPSIDKLRELQTRLAAEDQPNARLTSLLADRAWFIGNFWTRTYGSPITMTAGYRLPRSPTDAILRPWLTHHAVDGIRTWRQVIDAAREPMISVPEVPTEPPVADRAMSYRRMALGALARAAKADGLAVDRASRAAVGVELYRRDHDGTLPSSLTEIVPQYLDAIPSDPASGRPLRYTSESHSYTIAGEGDVRIVLRHRPNSLR